MKYRFNELASEDVQTITRFYIQERRNLGVGFIEELFRSVSLLTENPYLGQTISDGYRRLTLRRFPYALVYRIEKETDTIRIMAVRHQRRRPRDWGNRVDEPGSQYTILPEVA